MKLKKLYSFLTLLTAFLWLGTGTMWGEDHTLKVAEGSTTNTYLPVYSFISYYGSGTCQVVYPSSKLSSLPDSEIKGLTFYTSSSSSSVSWGTATFDVILSEISETTLSGIVSPSSPTVVYSGALSVSSGTMNITFTNGFEYTAGKNLLVSISATAKGNSNSATWRGISSTGAGYYSYTSSWGSYAYAANFMPEVMITYGDAPACKKIKNLAANSITTNSATISWSAGNSTPETEWNLKYKKASEESWTIHNGLDATSFPLAGLESGTKYEVQVQPVCSELESGGWSSISFTTIYGLPFSEDFDGITSGIPAGWNNTEGTVSETYRCKYYSTGNSGSCVRFDSYYPSKGQYNFLKTPAIYVSGPAKLTFYYKNPAGGDFSVYYSLDGGITKAETPLASGLTGASSWTKSADIALPEACYNQNVTICFKGTSNCGSSSTNNMIYLDDVLIESTQDCSKPATPTYSDLTGNSVTINWAANAGVTDYKYINVDRTANPSYVLDWENDATPVTGTSVALSELVDGHNYEFYVMCGCGTVASEACTYTPLSCPNVTEVSLSNQLWNGVTINWTTSATTNCDVQYKAGSGEWQTAETNTSATSKSFSGLVPGTEYSFRVKPHCSADGWVSPALPYTPVCPTPGALTLSNQTYNGVTVSWDEIVGVGTWNLEYQQGDLGWVPVPANPLSTTTYTFSDLVTDVEHSFRVQAGCEGAWSSIATYTPIYEIPAVLTASPVKDVTATLNWSTVDGASGYQYSCVKTGQDDAWSATQVANSVSLSGLEVAEEYTAKVRAVYSTGTSGAKEKVFSTVCQAPIDLVKGAVTSTSLAFSWSKSAESNADNRYQYVCKTGSAAPTDEQWTNDAVLLDEGVRNVTVEGLTSNTTYYFFVRSYYGVNKYSSAINTFNTTNCGVETLEYSETFGTSSATKPGCWTIANWGTSGNQWTTAGDFAYSGVALKYNAKTSDLNTSDAISPSIYIAEKCTLCFYVKNSVGSYSAKVQCQVFINDGTSDTEITDVTTNISGTTSGVNTRHTTATAKYYDMSSFVGKTVTLIFRAKGYDAGTTSTLWIDDVSLNYKPISAPTSLAAEPTADGADVTWDAEEGPYDLQYRVNGSSDAWTAVNGIATKTKTLTGLTLGTEYEVQVRAHASEHRISSWTASQTFTPASCPAVTAVTLSAKTYNSVTVNWTTASATNCDVQYKAAGDADWTPAATNTDATSKLISGLVVGTTYSFQVKPTCSADGWEDADETYTPAYGIPAPTVSGEAETQATVAWDAVVGATAYQYMVVAKDGDHSDWTGATDTDELSATLTGLTGGSNYDVWVRSNYSGNYSAEAKATFATTKVAPTTLVKEAATTESITFSWSYTGTVNQFQWKTSKAGSEWSAVQSDKSATATGLESGTTYTIYVRNYYADGIYSDVLSESFNTECAVRNLEFSENFNAGVVPACWNADNKTSYGWQTYNYTDETGSYCLRYNANGNSGYYEQLATPSVYLSEKATLKFVRKTTTTSPEFKVLISKDGGTNKEEIGSYSARTTKKTDSIVIADEYIGETVIFYFQGKSSKTSSRYVYLDDVQVVYKYISAPTNLAVSATTDGAVVTWTDDAEDGPWDLQYRVNGSSDAWTAVNSIAAKTYTLTGLTEQEYEVQVRTHASEHRISAWTASETFTPQCPNVTGVTFADETYNSVTVNWTADGEATWSLRYKTDGDWTTINNIDTKTYGLTGLTTGETYTVAVKASCKGDEGWVAAATTYTPTYGVPTNVTISAIKDVTATLAWDAAAGATGYQYIVLEGDVAADWTAPQSTTELTVDLSNLGAATTYSIYVRAAYGLNFGDATAKETFTTITYAPTNLAETAHDETSASFSWNHNAEGAATRYEYVALEGTDTPTGSTAWTLLDNNVTAATVDGLNTGAAYTFYVRSVYANDAKSDYASLAFSTECAVRNMPFDEDFEAGVSPLCWSAMNGTVDYYDYSGNNGWQVVNDGGNYVMRYKSHSSAATLTPLTMPQINVTAKALLSFKSLNTYSNKTVAAKVIISAAGEENYEVALVTSSALKEQYIAIPDNFTGKVVTIKFQATANVNGGRIDLDDVRVVRGEVFADAADNSARLATLKTAGETMDVVVERTLYCDGDYNTICLPFDLTTLDGTPLAGGELWAFRYGYVENGELLMRIAPASSIAAGVPYLITFTSGANIVNPIFTNVTISKSAGVSVGQTEDVQFIGILKPQPFTENDKNNLFVATGGMLAWSEAETGAANSYLRSFRGYFHTETAVSGTPVSNHMPARIVRGEQVATGFDDVHGDVQSLKLLENGRVVIFRNGVKYSVQGQVISK